MLKILTILINDRKNNTNPNFNHSKCNISSNSPNFSQNSNKITNLSNKCKDFKDNNYQINSSFHLPSLKNPQQIEEKYFEYIYSECIYKFDIITIINLYIKYKIYYMFALLFYVFLLYNTIQLIL